MHLSRPWLIFCPAHTFGASSYKPLHIPGILGLLLDAHHPHEHLLRPPYTFELCEADIQSLLMCLLDAINSSLLLGYGIFALSDRQIHAACDVPCAHCLPLSLLSNQCPAVCFASMQHGLPTTKHVPVCILIHYLVTFSTVFALAPTKTPSLRSAKCVHILSPRPTWSHLKNIKLSSESSNFRLAQRATYNLATIPPGLVRCQLLIAKNTVLCMCLLVPVASACCEVNVFFSFGAMPTGSCSHILGDMILYELTILVCASSF